MDGTAVCDVGINVRSGWNNYSGDVLKIADSTDTDGMYKIKLYEGYYTLEFKREGYITSYLNIIVYSNISISDAVICPQLKDNEMRVVLTWGDKPNDLDSYLELTDYNNHKSQVFFWKYIIF